MTARAREPGTTWGGQIRLIDTNICVAYLNGGDPGVRDRLQALNAAQAALCGVVKAELLYGARHGARVEANLRNLGRFFECFESLPFDDAAAHWYGIIRAQLRKEGKPIGANDLLIAAIARAADAVLVTRDEDEFARVAGLRLESW